MATLADGSFRAEFSPTQLLPAPAQRFLCGCRDCAFRREEAWLSIVVAVEQHRRAPQPASLIPLCEEA